MKKEYNKTLILDYISGNDIEEKLLEELEDNYLFMFDVIKLTKDKKMYNLCSDNVKKDYNFVKLIIDMFSYDIQFITIVADNYLNNISISEDDINYRELLITMAKIIGRTDDKKLLFYCTKAYSIYIEDSIAFTSDIMKEKNKSFKLEMGLGFLFFLNEYGTSEIIMDYVASNFISRIFIESNLDLEKLIHKDFKDFRDLEKHGINNFIIGYINNYDTYLATYVSSKVELLNDLRKRINFIQKNWDNYVKRTNMRKIAIFIYEANKYIDDHEKDMSLCGEDALEYIIKKFDLLPLVEPYFPLGLDEEFSMPIQEEKLNVADVMCIKYLTELVNELCKSNIIDVKNDDYEDEKNNNTISKIVRIKIK
jgi:hypothetical protein